MAFLPQFVVLKSKSNSKYLSYVEESNGETYLKFQGENIFSLKAKFEIEPKHHVPANEGSSKPGRPRQGPSRNGSSQPGQANKAELVHIRCCYNSRYLVGIDDTWIVPEAKEQETDTSKSSCTLFESEITDASTKTFHFRHVQLQRLLSTDRDTDALSADLTKTTVEFVVIDFDSLLWLPRLVQFKDDRGYYLYYHDRRYMKFAEKGKGTVMNDVVVTGDGYIRIKPHGQGHDRFWRRDPASNLIYPGCNVDSNGNDIDDALFWPVNVDGDTIALCNKSNNWFCRRATGFRKKDLLIAAEDGIVKEARLVVEVPVVPRRIRNVKFHLKHATIEKTPDAICTKEVTNGSHTENLTNELKFSYELAKSYTWSSSIHSKFGFGVTFTAGIPEIVNGKLQISAEASNSFQWGDTVTNSVRFESTVTVNVKPQTTATARVSGTKVLCKVPFSYTPCYTLPGCNNDSDGIEDGYYRFVTWLDIKDYNEDQPIDAIPIDSSPVNTILKELMFVKNSDGTSLIF